MTKLFLFSRLVVSPEPSGAETVQILLLRGTENHTLGDQELAQGGLVQFDHGNQELGQGDAEESEKFQYHCEAL